MSDKKQHDPVVLYNEKEAPKGKLFGPDDELPKGKDWVDTPAKFKAKKGD
jgi:hypothetical protein